MVTHTHTHTCHNGGPQRVCVVMAVLTSNPLLPVGHGELPMAFLCHAVPILPRNISPSLLYLTQFNPHLCISQPVSLFTTRTFPSCITPGNKKESINVLNSIYLCSSEGKQFFFSVWFQLVTEWYSLLKMSFCMWLALKSTSYNIRSNPENWTQKNLTQGPLTTFFPEL